MFRQNDALKKQIDELKKQFDEINKKLNQLKVTLELKTILEKRAAGYASSVKPHEAGNEDDDIMINYGIINLASQDKFQLVEGVTYLWVLTQNETTDQPGEIYLGVENPLDYPQAFHEHSQNRLKEKKQQLEKSKNQIKLSEENQQKKDEETNKAILATGYPGFGHPTLAIKFDKNNGKASRCKAYIGGELVFEEGHWCLNNRSGRYHKLLDGLNAQEMKLILELIAYQFAMHPSIPSELKVRVHTHSLDSLWNKYKKLDGKTLSDIAKMIVMKAFKENVQERLDSENDTKTHADQTDEYIEIKTVLFAKKFNDLKSLVTYLRQDEFIKETKEIYKKYKLEKTFTSDFENNLATYTDYLQSKISETELNLSPVSSVSKRV